VFSYWLGISGLEFADLHDKPSGLDSGSIARLGTVAMDRPFDRIPKSFDLYIP
jgi:hypothetical protein